MQFAGSVNQQIIGNAAAGLSIVSPIDAEWFINIYGTPVDTQAQPFPTVPSALPLYKDKTQSALAKSYLGASYGETPTHREIQFATQDIPSIQLTIRQSLSPQVLAHWQLANQQLNDVRGY